MKNDMPGVTSWLLVLLLTVVQVLSLHSWIQPSIFVFCIFVFFSWWSASDYCCSPGPGTFSSLQCLTRGDSCLYLRMVEEMRHTISQTTILITCVINHLSLLEFVLCYPKQNSCFSEKYIDGLKPPHLLALLVK